MNTAPDPPPADPRDGVQTIDADRAVVRLYPTVTNPATGGPASATRGVIEVRPGGPPDGRPAQLGGPAGGG